MIVPAPRPYGLPAMAIATCLGIGKAETASRLFSGWSDGIRLRRDILPGRTVPLGGLPAPLPPVPAALSDFDCRNNRLIWALLSEIATPVDAALHRYGPDRIAVVIGTSTSGIAEGEEAVAALQDNGQWPDDFFYRQQEHGSPAAFVARALGLRGPAYVVATACSSSAKTFAAARRLIRLGLADAVLVGGADTLCRTTVAGFSALEAMARTSCLPFSANRQGMTIGEGGSLFLMTAEAAPVSLLGVGESGDAHHISAPDPNGTGARAAIQAALSDAGLAAGDIAYVNLHGTATQLNDAMESKAVNAVFGPHTPCSSTKAITGHTLGAAGAVEVAFLWLALSPAWNPTGQLPPQVWDGAADPALPPLALVPQAQISQTQISQTGIPAGRAAMLSNSFAFGGSNCAVILGQTP